MWRMDMPGPARVLFITRGRLPQALPPSRIRSRTAPSWGARATSPGFRVGSGFQQRPPLPVFRQSTERSAEWHSLLIGPKHPFDSFAAYRDNRSPGLNTGLRG